MSEEEVLDFLEHYGVLGMHWGIRNDDKPSGYRLQSAGVKIDPSVHASSRAPAKEVASLISNRYGFQITEVKNLRTNNRPEYERGTTAYVEHTPGKNGGVIFIKPEDIRPDMKRAEDMRWMAPGTTNVRGMLTHESAHAMFHAGQTFKSGFLAPKEVGPTVAARKKAMKAAMKQARKDGIPASRFASSISNYAGYSRTVQEAEAEMFSQYHWGTNTPKFVEVWGQTLHQEMGVDPTPFKEVVKRG